MSKKRNGTFLKGRSNRGPFIALPRAVLNSPAWAALTAYEVKLLLDMAAAFRGNNNGDLACTWTLMRTRGWSSRETMAKALNGLLDKGFIARTRQGGKRICNLYAVTWEGVDPCDGKIDVKPSPVPSNDWRHWNPRKIVDTAGVSVKHGRRVKGHAEGPPLARQACQ